MKFKQRIPERWWYLIDVVKGPTLVLIIKPEMLAYSQGDTRLSQGYIIADSPTPVYACRDKQNL